MRLSTSMSPPAVVSSASLPRSRARSRTIFGNPWSSVLHGSMRTVRALSRRFPTSPSVACRSAASALSSVPARSRNSSRRFRPPSRKPATAGESRPPAAASCSAFRAFRHSSRHFERRMRISRTSSNRAPRIWFSGTSSSAFKNRSSSFPAAIRTVSCAAGLPGTAVAAQARSGWGAGCGSGLASGCAAEDGPCSSRGGAKKTPVAPPFRSGSSACVASRSLRIPGKGNAAPRGEPGAPRSDSSSFRTCGDRGSSLPEAASIEARTSAARWRLSYASLPGWSVPFFMPEKTLSMTWQSEEIAGI